MGTALGLLPHSTYEETQMTLHSGDEILLYTDGLVETAGADGEEFGERRLLEWLATNPGGPWKARFDGLLENLHSFTEGGNPEDDLCLLAIRLP
jgi:sigma-B regulation protein RsbU (phosphoserine phosphatase)